MGGNLTKEYPSSWDDDGVRKWKEKAVDTIKSYYLSFRGSQYDEYMLGEDEHLLLAKICFALYGPPTESDSDATELIDGYKTEQKDFARELLNLILEVHQDKNKNSTRLLVGIIVVACKQDESEFCLPVFSIFTGYDPNNPNASRSYVDTLKRTYSSWDDWKNNNTLPMLKYAYPTLGFFTSSNGCRYEFDPNQCPAVSFGTSPACDLSSRIFGTTDTVAAITSFGCGIIGIASLMTPIGPAILLTSAIAGGSSAAYGTGRAIVKLHDKGAHGGSLTDLESFTLWFSIAATPLHFTTSIVNGALVRGAQISGRTFSSSMRMFATVLNFGAFGVDTVMIGFGIANMIEKVKNDQLTTLDVLQFSMSVFFFTNTLIRPKVASTIIRNAQEAHIQNFANQMSDADAKATFDRFLEQNKGEGSIGDNSKIIRTINRINDPNKLFGDLKNTPEIKIGGRKGKTLLVGDQNQRHNRINPNNVSFAQSVQGSHAVNLQRNIKKVLDDPSIKNAKIGGKQIFNNLNDRQLARCNKAIGAAAGRNKLIVSTAIDICEKKNWNSVDDVLSVVEILSAQLKKDNPRVNMNQIDSSHIGRINIQDFIGRLDSDLNVAVGIANRNGLSFSDPLKAVYHYRKHGDEFAAVLKNNRVEVYLTKVPASLIQDGNLAHIETKVDVNGNPLIVEKIYITPDDKFAVVVENLTDRNISTLYHKNMAFADHRADFKSEPQWTNDLVTKIAQHVNQDFGFLGAFIVAFNYDHPEERTELKVPEGILSDED